VLNEASGRWPVEVDADGAVPCQLSVRSVNAVERELNGGCMSFCSETTLKLQKDVSRLEQELRELEVAMTKSKLSAQEHEMMVERRPEMNGRTGVLCGRFLQASMLCSC
jgi:hypothetical protein